MTRTLLLLLPLGIACKDDPTDDTAHDHEHAVDLAFTAVVGAEAWACGGVYSGLGTTGTSYTATDLRLYVSAVQLLDAEGGRTPLALEQDGAWQLADLALLDFEDATGPCSNGTAEVNTTVRGTVPHGDYTGVELTVGVPFALNHADSSTAPSPLNLSTMFWSWQSGYKFIRIEGTTAGLSTGTFLHLGSTGCDADDTGVVTGCGSPNRPTYRFDMDPFTDTLALDLAALFAGTDLDSNTPETAAGCMSAPSDPDCAGVFAALGLDFGGVAGDPAAQTLLRVP